jgi:PST family polysaccharide transporter
LAAAILFLAQGLSLAWYFQGIEKANLAVLFEASSQIIYFCGLIIFVRSKADYVVAVYTQAAANWLSLLAAFLVLGWRERIISPTRYGIWDQMVASSTFFWLRAGQLVYGGAVPLILGYLSTSRELAYFGIADKFLVLIVALMNPLSQALVPFFSRHTTERGFLPLPTILLILFATVTLCCAFCTAVAFEAENIVHLVFGQDFIQSVPALKLFCICGPLVVSSIVISQFVLIPLRMERYVIMTALPSGALSILVTIFLVPPYGAIGAATARLITELLIASVLAVVFIKRATGHHQLWSSRRS